MIRKNNLIDLFVTCIVGKIPFAPGSFGSIIAYPFIYILYKLLSIFKIEIIILIIMMILIMLFFLGARLSSIYISKNKVDDPKEIVIDELVGQSIILLSIFPIIDRNELATFQILFYLIIPFLLFRLFDIIKPWPISWFDQNIKGGIGVMLDDLIASIISIVIYYNIYFILR